MCVVYKKKKIESVRGGFESLFVLYLFLLLCLFCIVVHCSTLKVREEGGVCGQVISKKVVWQVIPNVWV